ncbi:PstS family phosphate ABC transporter substrate-binding protein [Pedobacter glucosidilyticus]|uniref:PstS family phosphate ABC transporter substrate-binding protein n=1 Tax=Pedobacter glucosidilyticus TaxID=1122941 RepID=UPI0003F89856|nr:substrate-binding domain-containing protein [Pedobacter glucosidilyticus]
MNNLAKVLSLVLSVLMISCQQRTPESQGEENYTFGTAQILADESLFTIIDDEHQIFSNQYKRAQIKMVYKPLKEVLDLFVNDSIAIAVLPRELKANEAKYFEDKKIKIRATKFATDGIAIITGKDNLDSLITLDEIKAILSGKSNKNIDLVFDNPKSSTVEYLMELAKINKLPDNNVYALKSSKEVIQYIKNNPDAIGVLSVSWIKRPTPDLVADIEKIKFMAVKNSKGEYLLPTQSNLKTGSYPLIRDLYLIDCQGKAGLGTGFAAFLASDIGQRIILKAGLAPDSLPSRQINVYN